jgi:hypothetical protein
MSSATPAAAATRTMTQSRKVCGHPSRAALMVFPISVGTFNPNHLLVVREV